MAFEFESQEFSQYLNLVNVMIKKLEEEDSPENQFKELAEMHKKISNVFFDQAKYLDQYIIFTKNELHYMEYIQSQINDDESKSTFIKVLNTSCGLLYIYLKELTFRSPKQANEINIRIPNYISFIEDFISDDHDFNFYKEYGRDKLHFEILRNVFHSENFNGLLDTEVKLNQIKNDIKNWENSLSIKEKNVSDLEKRLVEVKSTYDFVLLNKGFKELYDQKKLELKERRKGYSQFGATLVCVPLAVIIGIIILILTGYESKLASMWFLAIPITTLMLFLFYFTRVGLQHVRSVQSQMMQLELRMALCQFIHNYAEDSEKLHKKNPAGFERFENIIFSPLVSSDDKIPTTFDGMEQLAKLVSEFRK